MQDQTGASDQMTVTTQGIPLETLQQFVMQSLPVAAVAHSYHVEALADPRLQNNEAFQQFSLVELNELHHQIAAVGNVLRLAQGDQSAAQWLGYNLSGFLQNRMLGLQLAQRLPQAAKQNPAMQRVMALTELSNRQVQQYLPTLQRTLSATTAGAPALLVQGYQP